MDQESILSAISQQNQTNSDYESRYTVYQSSNVKQRPNSPDDRSPTSQSKRQNAYFTSLSSLDSEAKSRSPGLLTRKNKSPSPPTSHPPRPKMPTTTGKSSPPSTFSSPPTRRPKKPSRQVTKGPAQNLLSLMNIEELHLVNIQDDNEKAIPDWNLEFQQALEADSHLQLYNIAVDFIETAKLYGRVVIAEQHLPESLKTIQSFQAGGVAGGAKYKVRNMLIKLVQDPMITEKSGRPFYLYGGRNGPNYEFASKSAAHDLRGASQLFRVGFRQMQDGGDSIRVPMQVVIDYHGYRAVCMPWINLNTIVNGFREGVLHNHTEYKDVASSLHLASHGTFKGKQFDIAADVEIHLGQDNRVYGLDLARLFPPEHPGLVKHLRASGEQTIFFRLQRPEHLLNRKILGKDPLSSDALSNFSIGADDYKKQNKAVATSTHHLINVVIPLFAKQLQKEKLPEPEEIAIHSNSIFGHGHIIGHASLASRFHKEGVNVRHMGLVRSHITSEKHRAALLVEMVARSLKNMLRGLLRSLVKRTGRYSDLMKVVVRFLNLIVGSAERRMATLTGGTRTKYDVPLARQGSTLSTQQANSIKRSMLNVFEEELLINEFWEYHVYPGICSRFGKVALKKIDSSKSGSPKGGFDSYVNKAELYDLVLPELYKVVTYMLDMVGFRLTSACLGRFAKGLTTKKALKVFNKFHIVDLMPTSLRVKKLSVLDLAQGRMLLDSTFEHLHVIPVSKSLLGKAVDSFEKIVKAEPSDTEAVAELENARALAELIKPAKTGQAFPTIAKDRPKWAGLVTEGGDKKGHKRLLVVSAYGISIFKINNLKTEIYGGRISYQKVGLVILSKTTNQFMVCMPSIGDRVFHSTLAKKVCKVLAALVGRFNCTDMRYLQVIPGPLPDTKSTPASCIRGLRRANAERVQGNAATRRCRGPLLISRKQKPAHGFYAQLRGSILSGLPLSAMDFKGMMTTTGDSVDRRGSMLRSNTLEMPQASKPRGGIPPLSSMASASSLLALDLSAPATPHAPAPSPSVEGSARNLGGDDGSAWGITRRTKSFSVGNPQTRNPYARKHSSWLSRAENMSSPELLEPIDLIGCNVSPSEDPERPADIDISWWNCDKDTVRLSCVGHEERQMWCDHLKLAACLANVVDEDDRLGSRWVFDSDMKDEPDDNQNTNYQIVSPPPRPPPKLSSGESH
ncbi:hypothetical protein AAMO2058_001310200 [Amorphochlora amoebiformis]